MTAALFDAGSGGDRDSPTDPLPFQQCQRTPVVPTRKLKPGRAKKSAAGAARGRSRAAPRAKVPAADAVLAEHPLWNGKDHSLTWRGRVVKHFKAAAPSQEAVLAAFQAAGWLPCIPVEAVAPYGLHGKNRLRNTLTNLTHGCGRYLRFWLEGNGTRMRWAPR